MKYKTISETIPANSSKTITVQLSEAGKKVALYSISFEGPDILQLSIDDVIIADLPSLLSISNMPFIMLNYTLLPTNVLKVKGVNQSGSPIPMIITFAYELLE